MPKVVLLGDTHGHFETAERVLDVALERHENVASVIQVGDFGYGFPGAALWQTKHRVPILWIDGNHDNHHMLAETHGEDLGPPFLYTPRGVPGIIANRKFLMMGGASSPEYDKRFRTAGYDWWPEESIGLEDYRKCLTNILDGWLPDVMISHDFPSVFNYYDGKNALLDGQQDRDYLNGIWEMANPALWFFGHHHRYKTGTVGATTWHCCPIIDDYKYLLLDLNTMQVELLSSLKKVLIGRK